MLISPEDQHIDIEIPPSFFESLYSQQLRFLRRCWCRIHDNGERLWAKGSRRYRISDLGNRIPGTCCLEPLALAISLLPLRLCRIRKTDYDRYNKQKKTATGRWHYAFYLSCRSFWFCCMISFYYSQKTQSNVGRVAAIACSGGGTR